LLDKLGTDVRHLRGIVGRTAASRSRLQRTQQAAVLAAVRRIEQDSPFADATAFEISRLLDITIQAASRAASKLVDNELLRRDQKTERAYVAYTTTSLGQQFLERDTADDA
jgi:DNA-binding MarR family transcriptional regulator